MNQSFIIVHRKLDGFQKIYTTEDVMEAMAMQKAFIITDDPSSEILHLAKTTIKEAEFNAIIGNLKTIGRDRVSNDEEEVYIFYCPGRERMR